MGTKARKCIWWQRGKRDYIVEPPGWKPKHGIISFVDKEGMIEFARASKLVLKQKGLGGNYT